jgi:hypothetical protein
MQYEHRKGNTVKILVLLDGSKFSEEIVEPVKQLVSRGGEYTEISLVHVLDQRDANATWTRTPSATKEISGVLSPPGSLYSRSDLGQGLAVETKNQASDRQHDEAREYLRHVSALHFNGMARTEVLFATDIASAIAKYAEAENLTSLPWRPMVGLGF